MSATEKADMPPSPPERILFVTGRLAEPALRRVVGELTREFGFTGEVAVLGISVAALMHTDWVLRKLDLTESFDRVVLPGWCQGELAPLTEHWGCPVERGPKDLYDLPLHFGQQQKTPPDLSRYDIEILAEINHAPRMSLDDVLRLSDHYRDSGADVIDVGCVPGEHWAAVGQTVRALVGNGHRVSIDSFDRREVEAAVAAGADLVLSCNTSNVDWAAALPAELVAIPDDPHDLSTLEPTIERLQTRGARFRIDPILEPIGFGFAASLGRYYEVRRRWPELNVLMGIGNLTELTEVDSAGVNLLLAAICQELRIGSVLTTEVINWCRSAVREFDVARRLARHAVTERVLPKHVHSELVLLRDPHVVERAEADLKQLAAGLKDPNFRVFAERGELHVMNRDGYWRGTDPFAVFDALAHDTGLADAAHAFYLGYEFAKAVTALTLGKQYRQDQPLRWGFLTIPEISAVARRHREQNP